MYRYLILTLWLTCIFTPSAWPQQVEVNNNFFYLDGQKFFVKGIGYEVSALPGEIPWVKTFNPNQLHFDIQRILSGGFNTIRTWAPFTEQELTLLQQYNIKIIMGIWIDPHGDFADPQFVNNAKTIVQDVLKYSKKFDNIIAYLIMNEPLPEVIFSAGYPNTVHLWKELIQLIHSQHPNRPVSIANTCNGTYIESSLFDFSAYNVYIYNPVTVNYLHGYRDYIHYLQQLNQPNHPLIITEYGLSVCPSGPGNWGYGGNSLSQQQEGMLHMYKSLVDGGANGSCVFNYSDGWWKAGNEFVHDDAAEEWFGLVSYAGLTDNQGQVRPVWNAVKQYQSAIITQPQSGEIYVKRVPVELFLNDTIKRVEVMLGNSLIYQKQLTSPYLLDSLTIPFQNIKDVVLVFNAYDNQNHLVKTETKNILITATALTLPSIQISTNSNAWQTGSVDVTYRVNKSAVFSTDSKLDYIYYPHVGFDYGQALQTNLPAGSPVSFIFRHSIASHVNVFTVGAAFNITYGGFQKRIVNQLTLSRFNVSTGIAVDDLTATPKVHIFPNPATDYITVAANKAVSSTTFSYAIYHVSGRLVMQGTNTSWDTPINISQLAAGIYTIRLNYHPLHPPVTRKILKW